jgi:hypothetical protein
VWRACMGVACIVAPWAPGTHGMDWCESFRAATESCTAAVLMSALLTSVWQTANLWVETAALYNDSSQQHAGWPLTVLCGCVCCERAAGASYNAHL